MSVELPSELEREPAIAPLDVDVAAVFKRRVPRDRLERARIGRRARSLVSVRKGKYGRHRLARHRDLDIAVDATLRATAARAPELPLRVSAQDLRRKVREHRSPYAVCFVLDNSWSIHADRMVEQAKGVVFGLLEEAATRGDRVALVAFRGGLPEATVALPLTKSLALARQRLEKIPLAGQTPLADALRLGRSLLRQELFKHPNAVPLLVAVTDGLPTVALRPGGDPIADALTEARALGRAHVLCVVADTGGGGQARELADAAGGVCFPVERLARETVVATLEAVA